MKKKILKGRRRKKIRNLIFNPPNHHLKLITKLYQNKKNILQQCMKIPLRVARDWTVAYEYGCENMCGTSSYIIYSFYFA